MSYSFQPQMPTASSLFSAYASLSALAMLLRSIFNEFIPRSVRTCFLNIFYRLFQPRSNKLTFVIEEANVNDIGRNEVYDSAELYLSTKITNPSTDCLKISKSPNDKTLTIRFEEGEQINDVFDGVHLLWRFICQESSKHRTSPEYESDPTTSASAQHIKFFELTLEKEHKENVINNYIPYILSKSKSLKYENKTLKLCTLGRGNGYWNTTNLDHPSTFDTLAMDPDTKSAIKADLDRFLSRKEFYKGLEGLGKEGTCYMDRPGPGRLA